MMSSLIPSQATVRAGARGLVAAMAMSGVRTFTKNIGLLEESPPEAIVKQHAPDQVQRLTGEHRAVITELIHWAYGTAGGALFSALPARVRAHPLTGPTYGLTIWLSFELGLAPLLGLQHAKTQRPLSRAVLALDHVLYGLLVAGRLAPDPDMAPPIGLRHQAMRSQRPLPQCGRLGGLRRV
jgi:hypothetical protein